MGEIVKFESWEEMGERLKREMKEHEEETEALLKSVLSPEEWAEHVKKKEKLDRLEEEIQSLGNTEFENKRFEKLLGEMIWTIFPDGVIRLL